MARAGIIYIQHRVEENSIDNPSQNLTHNLGRFFVRVQKFLTLFPFSLDTIVLIEQVGEEFLLVELTDQSVLNNLLAMVDEEMHDSLRNLVGDGLADYIKVG